MKKMMPKKKSGSMTSAKMKVTKPKKKMMKKGMKKGMKSGY